MKKFKGSLFLISMIVLATVWWFIATRIFASEIDTGTIPVTLQDNGRVIPDSNSDADSLLTLSGECGLINGEVYAYLLSRTVSWPEKEIRSGDIQAKYVFDNGILRVRGKFSDFKGRPILAGYLLHRSGDSLLIDFQLINDRDEFTGTYDFRLSDSIDGDVKQVFIKTALSLSPLLLKDLYTADAVINRELLEPSRGYSAQANRVDPSYPLRPTAEQKEQLVLMAAAYRVLLQQADLQLALLKEADLPADRKQMLISNLLFWKDDARKHILELLTASRCFDLAENFAVTQGEADAIATEKASFLSLKNYYLRIFRF